MMSGIENPVHWLIVIAIALIVLGPKRLPEVGRSLGNGIRSFREAMTDGSESDERPARVSDAGEPVAAPEPAAAPEPVAAPEPAAAPAKPAND